MTVELWIEQIPDGLMRRIFRMHYIDGMTDVYKRQYSDYAAGLERLAGSMLTDWADWEKAGKGLYLWSTTPVSYTHLDVYKRQG